MSNKKKYKDLAQNTVLFTISSFGSKILTFLLVPLYTTVLTTSEYGISDLLTTTVMLLGYIFTLNISDAVLRFAIDSKEPEQILSFGIRILGVGFIVLGVLTYVLEYIKLMPWPSYCYIYMLLYYLGLQLSSILSNYLRAIDKIRSVAISGLLTTIITISCNIILLLLFNFQLKGYLLSLILGVFGTCVYQLIIIKLPLKYFWVVQCDNLQKKNMLLYCIPLIFNGVAWWINSSLDKYFITYLIGTAAAGIYAVAYKIPTVLNMIQSIFNQAWNLSAIREFDKEDSDGFFSNTYAVYNSGLAIASSVILIFNNVIAKLLFANEFFEAWRYAPMLLLSTLFSTMSGFIGSVFSAVKNSKVYAVSTVTAAFINIVLNSLLIPILGNYGAAFATVISFFVIWLIRLVCSKKYIKWKINLKKDVIVYGILTLQVIMATIYRRNYVIQLLCFSLIVSLYRSELKKIMGKVKKYIINKLVGKSA